MEKILLHRSEAASPTKFHVRCTTVWTAASGSLRVAGACLVRGSLAHAATLRWQLLSNTPLLGRQKKSSLLWKTSPSKERNPGNVQNENNIIPAHIDAEAVSTGLEEGSKLIKLDGCWFNNELFAPALRPSRSVASLSHHCKWVLSESNCG